MSVADRDGRIAEQLGDRLACLGMEINESMREARETLRLKFPELFDDGDPS